MYATSTGAIHSFHLSEWIKVPPQNKQWYVILGTAVTLLIFMLSSIATVAKWIGTVENQLATIIQIQSDHTRWISEAPPQEFRQLMVERDTRQREFTRSQSDAVKESLGEVKGQLKEMRMDIHNMKQNTKENLVDVRGLGAKLEGLGLLVHEHIIQTKKMGMPPNALPN